jgi:hypothetical protein
VQFAQPAIPTGETPTKTWVRVEADNALQGDAEKLNDDRVAISLKRPTRRWSERLRLADFDMEKPGAARSQILRLDEYYDVP